MLGVNEIQNWTVASFKSSPQQSIQYYLKYEPTNDNKKFGTGMENILDNCHDHSRCFFNS